MSGPPSLEGLGAPAGVVAAIGRLHEELAGAAGANLAGLILSGGLARALPAGAERCQRGRAPARCDSGIARPSRSAAAGRLAGRADSTVNWNIHFGTNPRSPPSSELIACLSISQKRAEVFARNFRISGDGGQAGARLRASPPCPRQLLFWSHTPFGLVYDSRF